MESEYDFEERAGPVLGVAIVGRLDGRLSSPVAKPPAPLVRSLVQGDPVNPGLQARVRVETADAAKDLDEHFLGGIGCVGRIVEHPVHQAVNRLTVASDEPRKGLFGAGLQLGYDQSLLGEESARTRQFTQDLMLPPNYSRLHPNVNEARHFAQFSSASALSDSSSNRHVARAPNARVHLVGLNDIEPMVGGIVPAICSGGSAFRRGGTAQEWLSSRSRERHCERGIMCLRV